MVTLRNCRCVAWLQGGCGDVEHQGIVFWPVDQWRVWRLKQIGPLKEAKSQHCQCCSAGLLHFLLSGLEKLVQLRGRIILVWGWCPSTCTLQTVVGMRRCCCSAVTKRCPQSASKELQWQVVFHLKVTWEWCTQPFSNMTGNRQLIFRMLKKMW